MARIGFIGLGNMGAPMAANLVRAGHAVTGFDLNAASMAGLVAAGGSSAASAADAARDAEVVITMLPAGQHVREVTMHQGGLIELLARAGQGALLIDCSTIDVETAREVAAAASGAGLDMLDAPVSGGTAGATNATLTFMVGGSDAAFARGRDILGGMGKNIVHAGGPGAGQAAKICNNMMLGINMIGVSEGFVLADRLGLDPQKLWDIASTSSGQSWALSGYCPKPGPVPRAPSNNGYAAGFALALMLKDMNLSQAAARASGAPTPLGAQAADLYRRAAEAGHAALDFSVVFRWLEGMERARVVANDP
jgi:3-hydroxyisobutyrate dehydrogenase